ncbi:MAG: hypothetical protein MI746_03940 [Pseudomonadales bacterium]|nr:hypothetical protein [Pseudomonadales bacterium]
MNSLSPMKVFAMAMSMLSLASASRAAVEQWSIFEIFSNADGDVQYIELLSPADVQSDLPNVSLTSFDRDNNLIGSVPLGSDALIESINTSVLFATQAFVDITGLEADQIIPEGFISTAGGLLDFAGGTSVVIITSSQLPLNGDQSIGFGGQIQPASPRNSDGLSAFVSVPVNASYSQDTGVLNLPVVDVPEIGVANVSFTVNADTSELTLLESFLYTDNVQSTATSAMLSSENVLTIPRLLFNNQVYELQLTLLRDSPVVFGDLIVLSVSDSQ